MILFLFFSCRIDPLIIDLEASNYPKQVGKIILNKYPNDIQYVKHHLFTQDELFELYFVIILSFIIGLISGVCMTLLIHNLINIIRIKRAKNKK